MPSRSGCAMKRNIPAVLCPLGQHSGVMPAQGKDGASAIGQYKTDKTSTPLHNAAQRCAFHFVRFSVLLFWLTTYEKAVGSSLQEAQASGILRDMPCMPVCQARAPALALPSTSHTILYPSAVGCIPSSHISEL